MNECNGLLLLILWFREFVDVLRIMIIPTKKLAYDADFNEKVFGGEANSFCF